ncbi:unnamed protein product [Durusdinium trenchii]|uniref:Uncharacterized protein n=1 Tax=Durusdinium trenchii TaxID=1381693 RepID=A0ABP0L5B1_9DINO
MANDVGLVVAAAPYGGLGTGRRRRGAFSEAVLLPSSSSSQLHGREAVGEACRDGASNATEFHPASEADSQELPKIGTQLFAPESTCCNCWIAWSMLLAYLQAENWPQDMRRGHCSKNMPQSEEDQTSAGPPKEQVALMLLFGAGNAWSSVLGFCEHLEVAAAVPCCSETAAGSRDGRGRLLTGSASLPGSIALRHLDRISPHLLVRLAIPSLASGSEGEAVLRMLAAMRDQLTALKEVCVHIAPPRLPRVTGETRATRSEAVSVLAGALSAALPWWLDSFQANLRGGCLLAGDSVLADLVGAIPKHLTRLGLDLNHFSSTDAQAVARCLPSSLRELRLLFHGRSFAWLGSGVESNGTEELASALPASLEKLHLMLESSAAGASLLCQALPPNLVHLALDLQMTLARRETEVLRLSEALAAALPRQLMVLQLRLTDFNLSLEELRILSKALPESLTDLRLDICCRDVGDDGASALASSLPQGLECLMLCLRDWRFSAVGARVLASAIPENLRRLKLAFSSSPIGASGARALTAHLPTTLSCMNLSLRHCSLGRDGEQALKPLARRWNALPNSWVRVYEKTALSVGLRHCSEWDLWDRP